MAHRKGRCEKTDFASNLERLGFIQRGDCTFYGETIKIFRTNKTRSERKRYWEIREIRTDRVFFRSNHTQEVLDFLQSSQLLLNGATFRVSVIGK